MWTFPRCMEISDVQGYPWRFSFISEVTAVLRMEISGFHLSFIIFPQLTGGH